MRFYVLKPVNGFKASVPATDESLDTLSAFDGKTRFAANWVPQVVEYSIDRPSDERLPRSAFPTFALPNVLVMSEETAALLHQFLKSHGKFLPLDCGGERYWAFNVLNQFDVLDLERSELEYSNSDPTRVLMIFRYAIKKTEGIKVPIFKVPQLDGLDILVSEEFKNLVEEANLQGLAFEVVD